ncbi:MAG: PAS domain S-box protein, partial [Bacteroidetes bacterium]|nr:PAS domain S-box protein [Bacteroidota bacterium]
IKNKAKDGSFYWVDAVITPIYNDKKEIEFYLSIQNNITEKKKIEFIQEIVFDITKEAGRSPNLQSLAKYIHQRINVAVNSSNLFLAIYNKKTECVGFPYYYDEFGSVKIKNYKERPFGAGLTEHIIKYKKSLFFNSQEELKSFIEAWEIKTFTGQIPNSWLGVPLVTENEVVGVIAIQSYTKENAYSDDDYKFLKFVSGQIALSVKRQKEQDDLMESRRKYQEIIQICSDIILSIDEAGKIIFANKAWQKKLGYIDSEVIGKAFVDFIHPDSQNRFHHIYKQIQSGSKSKIAIIEFINSKSEKIVCKASFNSSYHDNELVVTQAFFHDITRTLKAEAKFKNTYRELSFLDNLNKSVLNGADFEEIAEKSIKMFNELTGGKGSKFYFYDARDSKLTHYTNSEAENSETLQVGYFSSISLIPGTKYHSIINEKNALITSDIAEISKMFSSNATKPLSFDNSNKKNDYFGVKVFGAIPLYEGENVFGMVTFASRFELEPHIVEFMHKLAQNISSAFAKIRTKKELIEQKKFTEIVLNNLPSDLAVFNANQKYIFINKRGDGGNQTKEWLIGKDDFDYCRLKGVDLKIAEKRKLEFNNAISLNKPIEWIEEWINKNLDRKYILRRLVPYLEAEKPKYVIGYGTDVTLLKQAELSLSKSERLLSEAEKLANIGSCEIDLISNTSFWSDGFFRICGYNPKAIKPNLKTVLALIHPEEVDDVIRKITNSIKEHSNFRIEFRIIRPNKEIRNVLMFGEAYYELSRP